MPSRRILLVDDDIAEISAVKRVLGRLALQPALATNTADALAAIAIAAPDLILVGATCENGGAVAFTRQLGGDDATRAIPLVLLGEASGAASNAVQLPKPIDPGVLADRVNELLGPGLRRAAQGPLPVATPSRRPMPPPPSTRPAAVPAPSPDRRAAAEALRARAEELRRAGARPAASAAPAAVRAAVPPHPAPPERARRPGPAAAAVLAELQEPGSAPADGPPLDLGEGLDELLRRAEEAERARAAERKARVRQQDRAAVEAAQRAEAERFAIEKAARAREAEAQARAEARARADAETHRDAEERRRAEGDARRAEATRLAEEEGRRATAAEERADAEAIARERLASELERLRGQLESERKSHEAELQTVLQRAQADEEVAATLRQLADEEARAESERRAAEEAAKREEAEAELRRAIDSARSELEGLRRRNAEEAERRAMAEAELRRIADGGDRLRGERAAFARAADVPPDPNEEAARLRALAARDRRTGDPDRALRLDAPFERPTWLEADDRPAASGAPIPSPDFAPPVAGLRSGRTDPAAPPEGDLGPDEEAVALPPPPAELRAGNLGDLPAPRLLALAARAALSGRLDFSGDVARSVWFDAGRVVGAASAATGERVDEVALRLGLLTRDQHRQVAGAASALSTRHAARLLLDRGYLKPTELTGLVRRRTEEVLFALFAEGGAAFRWVASAVPAEERIALERGPFALAVEGIRRRWLAAHVDAVLGGAGTLLAPAANAPAPSALGLSPEERRVVALADGLRALDEIVSASPLDPLSTRQLLTALVLTGALAIRIHQLGRPASATAAAIDLARVREKLDQVRRADYFTILGVGRHCTPHEVREAADRLTAEFQANRFAAVQEDGLPGRLEEIRRVLTDAREVLADDALREEYVLGLGL